MLKRMILCFLLSLSSCADACYFGTHEELKQAYQFSSLFEQICQAQNNLDYTHYFPQRTYTSETEYLEDTLTAQEIESLGKLKDLYYRWMSTSAAVNSMVMFAVENENKLVSVYTYFNLVAGPLRTKETEIANTLDVLDVLSALTGRGIFELLRTEIMEDPIVKEIIAFDIDGLFQKQHIPYVAQFVKIEMFYNFFKACLDYKASLGNVYTAQ